MTDDRGRVDDWQLWDTERDKVRAFDSRSDAEQTQRDFSDMDLVLVPPGETPGEPSEAETDGGAPEVVESDAEPIVDDADDLPERSVADDPLDILPSYMIDTVQGTPALNKRGLSVLAFEYGVSVENREYLALPTETDWVSAIVETTVTNEDGNTFVGTGTAHVDRGDDAEILLELAETRSYKRAVSFATGTGIVAYQELTSDIEK